MRAIDADKKESDGQWRLGELGRQDRRRVKGYEHDRQSGEAAERRL